MVLFRYLQYGFRDTMRSLWRHKGMVMVSVITVAIMLIVLGATVLLAANSEYMTDNMEEELVPKAGYRLETISASGIARGRSFGAIKHNIRAVSYVVKSVGICTNNVLCIFERFTSVQC